jgi:sporulation integral membrane protein YtvI
MVRAWLFALAALAGFLGLVYLLLTYALPLVLPFAVALLIAELIDPIVDRISGKRKLPRTLAVAVVLVTFVLLLSTAVTVGIAKVAEEIRAVAGQLPYLYARGMDVGVAFADQFGRFNAALPDAIQGILSTNLATLQKSLSQALPSAASALTVMSSLPGFITDLLIALIATFFISRDKDVIGDFLLSLFPRVWHDQLRKVKQEVWSSTIGWAKAQMMLIVMTMVQTMIGLSLIGAKYWVVMGLVVGVFDMLPVLSPATIYLPWILYCFIFGSKIFGIKLLVLYGIVAGIRQVLEAKFVGDQIGLHPLAILVALYLGFHFFGALGFVAGPLLAILLKSMMKSGLLPNFRDPTDPRVPHNPSP